LIKARQRLCARCRPRDGTVEPISRFKQRTILQQELGIVSVQKFFERQGASAEPSGNSAENEVRVLASDFPGMRMFASSFNIRNKFFRVSPTRPENTRVLARSRLDIPVAWTTSHGKGRLFVSQIGPDDAASDRKDVQVMYLEAIRWVLHESGPVKNGKPSPATSRRKD
jgi:type 1 glutamine amidotransferase